MILSNGQIEGKTKKNLRLAWMQVEEGCEFSLFPHCAYPREKVNPRAQHNFMNGSFLFLERFLRYSFADLWVDVAQNTVTSSRI